MFLGACHRVQGTIGRLRPVAPIGLMLFLAGATLVGCAAGPDQRLAAALTVRHHPAPDYRDALCVLDSYRNNPAHKNEYALFGMCQTTVGVMGGNFSESRRVGIDTHRVVQKYQDATAETLAALGAEAQKFFKGEPHERSLLCFYCGLSCYLCGEYNDARIFFTQSVLAAATRDEDKKEFRDDFRLGHYWLGRAYLRRGQEGNARVAFQRAGKILCRSAHEREQRRLKKQNERDRKSEAKLEATCYRKATGSEEPVPGVVDLSVTRTRADLPDTLPDATETSPVITSASDLAGFLDLDFQKRANLIIVVEAGFGPIKYLGGVQNSWDLIKASNFKERLIDVYIDGHKVGPALCFCDTYHQAKTRGVKTRRGRQTGKAIAKEVLRRLPYIGGVFGYWDVSGDARHVPVLPGQIQLFAAQVEPGVHDISLRCFDANGTYLPRFDVDRHFISVSAENETVLLMQTKENQDNAYLLQQLANAAAQTR